MQKWKWVAAGILVLAVFLFVSCSDKNEETNKRLPRSMETMTQSEYNQSGMEHNPFIIGSPQSPQMFNPLFSLDETSSEIENLIFDGLVRIDENLQPKLHLAEDIQQSDGGLTYTVKIRKGVKFHDGAALTADDVVFTFSIPLSPEYDGNRGSDFEMIKSVQKMDDYTVQFRLNRRNPSFLPVTLTYGILPKHLLKKTPIYQLDEHPLNFEKPVGTGPFRFVKWEKNNYIEFAANDQYFLGKPFIQSIKYQIVPNKTDLIQQIQNGEIHYAFGFDHKDAKMIKKRRGINIQSQWSHSYAFIAWNQRKELFRDKRVRQALAMAIDKKSIIRHILRGEGKKADIPESPVSNVYTEEIEALPHKPKKAKQILKEAGWKDTDGDKILDQDGKKFSFTLKTNTENGIRMEVAKEIKKQLKKIGVEVQTEFVQWEPLIEQISPPNWDYDALMLEWSLSAFPNHFQIFHSSQRENGLNFVWWEDAKVDQLLEEIMKTTAPGKRKALNKELFQLIADEQPYTVLYYPKEYRVIPKYLNGYTFHHKNPFYKINEWAFAENFEK